MFGLVAVVQQAPFGFTFEDDGIFQQMSGKGKADNLYLIDIPHLTMVKLPLFKV